MGGYQRFSKLENGRKIFDGDVKEGVDKYKELCPNVDLVTMDITMPVLDGIEALKKIKGEYPEAKVIMVTAAGQKTKMVEAVQNGASEFVSKPFEPEQLKSIIEKVME